MRDKIFYTTCFGFLFGVLLRSFVFVNLYFIVLLGFISLTIVLFFSLISKNRWGIVLSVFIVAFSFGIVRFAVSDKKAPDFFLEREDSVVSLYGEIIDEPSIKEKSQQLLVKTNLKEEKTKILINTDFSDDYKYGYKISFVGTLETPENFITDQGKIFDYVNYLRKDDIYFTMSYPEIKIISKNGGNFLRNFLFKIKENFLEKTNLAIRPPENLLLGGLILGEKSAFNAEMRKNFVDTGTIHIVALSGYNITIVSEWIMRMFYFLPAVTSITLGIISIFLFVLMTGAGSTALRAGIMAALALFARATGRNYDAGRILILTGVLMILFNPFLLVFDVSFQLSFLATFAVIFFAPKFEKYFFWVTKKFGLRDVFSVTTAVYIFVLPFILYKMGNLSLVALPANILILPFIPLTMGLGFLTGFLGLFHYVFSIPLGFFAYLMLHYELSVIDFFASFPISAFSFPDFPLSVTLLIYAYFAYKFLDISKMSQIYL